MPAPTERRPYSAKQVIESEGITIKHIEGWMLFADAAEFLGCSRWGFGWLVWTARVFDVKKDVRALGMRTLLVRESSVRELKRQRDATNAPGVPRTRTRTIDRDPVQDEEILHLEGWTGIVEAGIELGLSRHGVGWLVWHARKFDFQHDVRRAGTQIYMLRDTAIAEVKRQRVVEAKMAAEKKDAKSAKK